MGRARQRKATHLTEMPKRFVVLQNLLVLDTKLQYPALAMHPSTGVAT
jgi:hypothetical protein